MLVKDIFWFSFFLLSYVYFGYYLVLSILAGIKHYKIKPESTNSILEPSPMFISVIIAAYNEEQTIVPRIENLLSLNYPKERLEIIIASDGSSDKTVEFAQNYSSDGVRVLDFKQNRGRAMVHNDAMNNAIGEVVVFTDAETVFDINFLHNLALNFRDPSIGCVIGNLIYKTDMTAISESEGLYWKFEKKLRNLESDLGILATGTGACMAIRRNLWEDIGLTDDVDFITPLDVIFKGFHVVFATDVVAYDRPASSVRGEFRTRIRQTSKNFMGTIKHWRIMSCINYPAITMGLFSHKILRWFSPFFMFCMLVTNVFLIERHTFYLIIFIGQAIFYLIGMIGYLIDIKGEKFPIVSSIYSFCVANAGMGVGIVKAFFGKVPVRYRSSE